MMRFLLGVTAFPVALMAVSGAAMVRYAVGRDPGQTAYYAGLFVLLYAATFMMKH